MKLWHYLIFFIFPVLLFLLAWVYILNEEPGAPGGKELEDLMAKEWNDFNQEPPASVKNTLREEGFPVEEFPLPGVMSLTAVNSAKGRESLEVIFTITPSNSAEKYWDGREKKWRSTVKGWYLTALEDREWDYSAPFASGTEETIKATRGEIEVEINILEPHPLYVEVTLLLKREEG